MKALNVYTCGPTVYAQSHIGHARTYVCLDMIRRIMNEYEHIPTVWAMNITDIDDKIINEFNKGETGFSSPFEYAHHCEEMFFKNMNELNVLKPDVVLHVTDVIPDIIEFVQDLIKNGYAYVSNGSVYFDVINYSRKFEYEPLKRASESYAEPNSDKHNPFDFALWKHSDDQPYWSSPWGNGRPGWHIECSTMCMKLFGNQVDIHCGGIDLSFPHHTN